jgi:beta-galactosidase
VTAALATAAPNNDERRVRFNDEWRFLKGDAPGTEAPGFPDSKWRTVTLPHDWAIEGPFDKRDNPGTGGLPISGTGWYRKHFKLAASEKGQIVSIEFDGAMSNARVWLNGVEVGFRPYGYASFAVDLTPHVKWGDENVLAAKLSPEPDSSRWYPGAGIYRNVWLIKTNPVHVAHWGTYVTTPQVSATKATVAIVTEVQNQTQKEARIQLETEIVDPNGQSVSRASSEAPVPANGKQSVAQELDVANPRLWDIDHPDLYKIVAVVKQNAQVQDRYETPFGIRTIEFNREKGFLLNGRYLKIHGVCNHHDLGALGAAVNVRALERQLEIMRSMGVNAIRTSHNPPAPELLDLTDRMGFLVMDEAFDMWRIPKVKNGLSKFFDQWHERDLRDMIRRDRNHPSVIMWSIGNEIPEQTKPEGGFIAKKLTEICHQEDHTRPTTSAFDQPDAAIRNELAANVDVRASTTLRCATPSSRRRTRSGRFTVPRRSPASAREASIISR